MANPIKFLFCEGVRGGYDSAILGKMVDELNNRPEIIPLGGKYGSPAFSNGYLTALSQPTDSYLVFRDRDFDAPVSDLPALFVDPARPKIFFSHRATIENYLYEPQQFAAYVAESPIKFQELSSLEGVESIFIDVAKELKYYQAARHALGKMRQPIGFQTTWEKNGSGHLPKQLDEDFIIKNSIKLFNNERVKAEELYSDTFFSITYELFINLFNDQFFIEHTYLSYFHAKDFRAMLGRKLPQFPFKRFEKFALENFEFRKFPDLQQLFDLLKKRNDE